MGRYLEILDALYPTGDVDIQAAKEAKEAKKAPLISHNSLISHFDTLKQVGTEACRGLSAYITPAVLLAKLCPEDVAELEASADPLPFLRSFAIAIVWTDFRKNGIAPPTWDKPAHCDQCGDVYLWASINVAGCPWCWNRLHGVKIPRPAKPSPKASHD